MSILASKQLKFITLFAIGLVSLVVTLVRFPVDRSFIGGQRIEASSFGMSVYTPSGNTLFSLSPLNDYYYDGPSKEHLENKLLKSDNGNLITQAVVNFNNLALRKDSLIWDTQGENSKGKATVNYTVEYENGGITITREVDLEKTAQTSIGQVMTLCSDCMVTDDKNKAYFNGDTVNSDLINIALKASKVPTIIGENQSFPGQINKIIIIGRDGKEKMSVPIERGDLIYLQDKWHILEIKTPSKTKTVIQTIYFGN